MVENTNKEELINQAEEIQELMEERSNGAHLSPLPKTVMINLNNTNAENERTGV